MTANFVECELRLYLHGFLFTYMEFFYARTGCVLLILVSSLLSLKPFGWATKTIIEVVDHKELLGILYRHWQLL